MGVRTPSTGRCSSHASSALPRRPTQLSSTTTRSCLLRQSEQERLRLAALQEVDGHQLGQGGQQQGQRQGGITILVCVIMVSANKIRPKQRDSHTRHF